MGAVVLAIGMAGVPMTISHVFALPGPTGRYPIGTVALSMAGLTRLTGPDTHPLVEVWYPARAAAHPARYGYANRGSRSARRLVRTHAAHGVAMAGTGERFPVLIYIAGWGGRRTDNTILAEELASQGFVVAAIDDLSVILPRDSELAARWRASTREEFNRSIAIGDQKVTLEARMASAVLDGLTTLDGADPVGRFTGRLDLKRVGALGFSLGGAAAAEACRQDARFLAAMNLDGYLFGAVATEGMSRPYFLANTVDALTPSNTSSTAPAAASPGIKSPPNFTDELDPIDEQRQNAILARTHGYVLQVARTSHMDFTDDPFFSVRRRLRGLAGAEQVARLLGAYAVAFFNSVLNGTPPGPPLAGPSPDPRAALRAFP